MVRENRDSVGSATISSIQANGLQPGGDASGSKGALHYVIEVCVTRKAALAELARESVVPQRIDATSAAAGVGLADGGTHPERHGNPHGGVIKVEPQPGQRSGI